MNDNFITFKKELDKEMKKYISEETDKIKTQEKSLSSYELWSLSRYINKSKI